MVILPVLLRPPFLWNGLNKLFSGLFMLFMVRSSKLSVSLKRCPGVNGLVFFNDILCCIKYCYKNQLNRLSLEKQRLFCICLPCLRLHHHGSFSFLLCRGYSWS